MLTIGFNTYNVLKGPKNNSSFLPSFQRFQEGLQISQKFHHL